MLKVNNLEVSMGVASVRCEEFFIEEGKCAALVGGSGSGKTTFMETICGLRPLISGSIVIHEEEVTQLPPAQRKVGLVPQENVLFPKLNVAQQLAFGLNMQKWEKKKKEQRVHELADLLSINPLLSRQIEELSGGEAKRVAIGRALAIRPKLLCLDECFTGLDDTMRAEVMQVVKQVTQSEQVTTLLISHRAEEVEALAHVRYGIDTRGVISAH